MNTPTLDTLRVLSVEVIEQEFNNSCKDFLEKASDSEKVAFLVGEVVDIFERVEIELWVCSPHFKDIVRESIKVLREMSTEPTLKFAGTLEKIEPYIGVSGWIATPTVSVLVKCKQCKAKGAFQSTHGLKKCDWCNGEGYVEVDKELETQMWKEIGQEIKSFLLSRSFKILEDTEKFLNGEKLDKVEYKSKNPTKHDFKSYGAYAEYKKIEQGSASSNYTKVDVNKYKSSSKNKRLLAIKTMREALSEQRELEKRS